MFNYHFVKCVTSGDGFKKGFIYPILGTNNGVHIMREEIEKRDNDPFNYNSDPHDFIACTGGVGKGLFNNFDGSGKPSFVPIDGVRENKNGEWIKCHICMMDSKEDESIIKYRGWKCNACGYASNEKYDYCPYCGADMRGEA